MRSWKIWTLVAGIGLNQMQGLAAQELLSDPPKPAEVSTGILQTATEPDLLEPNAAPIEPALNSADLPLVPMPPGADDAALPPVAEVATESQPAIKPPPPAKPKKKAPPQFPGPKTLPPTGPYKTLFFENDYSYKNDPNHQHLIGEDWKNVPFEFLDQKFVFSTGGELRHRYMNEDNRLRPGGPIQSDNDLIRWRHFLDVQAGDRFRFYVESIHADSFGGEAPVQQIDVNRWDLQNYFVDTNLFDGDLGKHTFRYGRQELSFGRQRLVSPLDWANTRRNFEGYRYMVKGDNYKLDFFAVNPVNSATGFAPVAVYDNRFDQAHHGVDFMGTYFSYTGVQNTVLEAYWMYQNTHDDVATKPDGSRHTMGSHVSKLFPILDLCGEESRVWDFDTEGAFQFGEDNTQEVFAGFYTAVAGHTWKQAPWTPRISGLFYYGSGDRNPHDNRNNTFSVMYPLGHAYWGLSDNLVGQNLINYGLQLDVKPTKKTAITAAYNWFELASNGDRAYNVAGAPVGTPGHGRNLGQSLDLYGYYTFSPNFDIQAGSSWFFYGTFIDRTAPRGDATQLYVQTTFRY
jgi:hypothetical protein